MRLGKRNRFSNRKGANRLHKKMRKVGFAQRVVLSMVAVVRFAQSLCKIKLFWFLAVLRKLLWGVSVILRNLASFSWNYGEFIEVYRNFPSVWKVKSKDCCNINQKNRKYVILIEKNSSFAQTLCTVCDELRRRRRTHFAQLFV